MAGREGPQLTHAAGLTADRDLIDAHVQHTVDLLLDRSRVLADQGAAGHTGVVGMAYQLSEGSARPRLVTAHGVSATAAPTAHIG